MAAKPKPAWTRLPENTLRKDIFDALISLRDHVENQGKKPSIILTPLSTYRQRELTEVQTACVGEWALGYSVKPLNIQEGFYRRSVFARLHGGILGELKKSEFEHVMDGITYSVMDEGYPTYFEPISKVAFALHQNFSVMFLREGNPNVLVPSKGLILSGKVLNFPKNKKEEGNG